MHNSISSVLPDIFQKITLFPDVRGGCRQRRAAALVDLATIDVVGVEIAVREGPTVFKNYLQTVSSDQQRGFVTVKNRKIYQSGGLDRIWKRRLSTCPTIISPDNLQQGEERPQYLVSRTKYIRDVSYFCVNDFFYQFV